MAIKTMRIDGLPQFEKALRKFKDELIEETKKAVAVETINVRNAAVLRLTSPSGDSQSNAIDTGQLRQSIHTRFANNGLSGDVFTRNRHAPFIEFGTGTRNVVPDDAIDAGAFRGAGKRHAPFSPDAIRALTRWAQRHGFKEPESAAWAIAKAIYRKGGLPPRPYLYPSIRERKPHFIKRMETAIKELERRHRLR